MPLACVGDSWFRRLPVATSQLAPRRVRHAFIAISVHSSGRLPGGCFACNVIFDRAVVTAAVRGGAAELGVPAERASMHGQRWFQLQSGKDSGGHGPMGEVRLSFAACDADGRRQLYRQPLLDLQEPSTQGVQRLGTAWHLAALAGDERRFMWG